MERAAKDEANSSLCSEILEFDFHKDLEKYQEESRTPLFDNSNRAFVIYNCSQIPNMPSENDCLICVLESGKQISDSRASRVLNFPKLKQNNEYIGWIVTEGEKFNIDLTRVANALFVNCGNRLRKLSSEIEKLSFVTSPGKMVSPEDAKSLICFSAELTPKNVIDSVCSGKTAMAIAYYDKLQEIGNETGWILSYMHRHVIQFFRLNELILSKVDEDTIANSLGVSSFILQKFILPLKDRWSKKSLAESIKTLSDAEVLHKSGNGFGEFLLQSEIIRLSEEARINVHA